MNEPCPIRAQRNWRLIVDGPQSGVVNMARDEAVAVCAGGGAQGATLRVYSFEPATVTLGRFQAVPAGMSVDGCAESGIDIVRRPTGGLAILHEKDFTYSVVLGHLSASGITGERARYFDLIAVAVIESLCSIGVAARQVRHGGNSRRESGWCFDGEHGIDIEWRGRKICGSAQRQYHDSLLQHGSLFPGTPGGKRPAAAGAKTGTGAGGASFVTVTEAASRPVTWDELLEAFALGFERALGINLEPGYFSSEEEKQAKALAAKKYSSSEWLMNPKRREAL